MKFYTSNLLDLFLSPGAIKIKILQYFLPGIDHFLSDFRVKLERRNSFNVFNNFKIVQCRIIQSSVVNLVKVFNFIDLFIFEKAIYIHEIEIITFKNTFQDVENHAEKFFLYNPFYRIILFYSIE